MAQNVNLLLEEFLEDNLNLNIIYEEIHELIRAPEIVGPQRNLPVRNKNYYELVIPTYNLDDFYAHFRMSRGTFQVIIKTNR